MYGAEAVILNLARAMREHGHNTVLGVFSNSAQPNDQFYQRAVAEGLEVCRIGCKGQLDLSVPGAIRRLAVRSGAEIVHAHGYKGDLYSYAAMRRTRTPLVSTCHTWYDNDAKVRLYGALDRWVLKKYSRVVAVSEEVRQRLLHAGVAAHRIHSIRNGIDLRPFAAVERNYSETLGPTVGLVGRLAREKGVDLFLQAAALVLAEMPAARFLVVGDGPDRAGLEALIGTLGLAANTELLGHREDMPAFYGSVDLLVSASRQEGLPIALLEGMASGLPLAATSVGEVPTLVRDGRAGLLVPPEDVSALAQAMLTLLHDGQRRRTCGGAARALIAAEFSAERMAADYLYLYEQVIAGGTQ